MQLLFMDDTFNSLGSSLSLYFICVCCVIVFYYHFRFTSSRNQPFKDDFKRLTNDDEKCLANYLVYCSETFTTVVMRSGKERTGFAMFLFSLFSAEKCEKIDSHRKITMMNLFLCLLHNFQSHSHRC